MPSGVKISWQMHGSRASGIGGADKVFNCQVRCGLTASEGLSDAARPTRPTSVACLLEPIGQRILLNVDDSSGLNGRVCKTFGDPPPQRQRLRRVSIAPFHRSEGCGDMQHMGSETSDASERSEGRVFMSCSENVRTVAARPAVVAGAHILDCSQLWLHRAEGPGSRACPHHTRRTS